MSDQSDDDKSQTGADPGAIRRELDEGAAKYLHDLASVTGDRWWRAVATDIRGITDTDALVKAFTDQLEPDRRYPSEARRVAARYLDARRQVWGSAVVLALISTVWIGVPVALGLSSLGTAILNGAMSFLYTGTAVYLGMALTRAGCTLRWLHSLRSLMGYPPPASDLSAIDYVRAVAEGRHAAGELERAFVALWNNADPVEQEAARQVLADRGIPDPSDPEAGYERDPDSSGPMWHRAGTVWYQAPPPGSDHDECTPWTLAVVHPGTENVFVIFRCPCGAVGFDHGGWEFRNHRTDGDRVTVSDETT